MSDVNANIGVNIDTSAALDQLKSLQRQISLFHTSVAKSSEAAALAQRDLQRNFLNSISSIGAFSAEFRTVKTTSESFTSSLEKNKFSMREYFRYAGASTKTFGQLFKSEYDTIGKVAEDRVKKLQTQYIKMGRDASGAMKAIAITPNQLDMNSFATQTQIAAQKQALFNQLMKQGSTNLLNFGKNTQWAGRQLMVGFTLPLIAVGSAATKTFMQMEAQAIKFKKVYGDIFTPQAETQQALADIKELGKQFTKYGVSVSDTVGLAADAAAAGFKGLDLQRQTTEATRLSVLGQIDNQKALQTTISLQNAFGISSADLTSTIDFLNAVENQTVLSLDDITTAIPKVAPIIQQLGGNVKDLAFFLTAMKQGGVNASEGANALKSGLASLINPSTKARTMLKGLGVDIVGIVQKDKGDLKKTVIDFAMALDTLAPLQRAQAIETMFGKFQFARLSTLFQNVTKDGTQASEVLKLAGTSVQDLASLSNKELNITADSPMNKFKKAVEDLKFAIVPVGEAFLKAVTPVLNVVSKIANGFSHLSDGTKKAITLMVVTIGGLGPILLMTFGLLSNGVANVIKLFLTLRTGYQKLTGQSQNLGEQTQYMTSEQIDAAAAAHSLNQAHATLTQQFTVEAEALQKLIAVYQEATSAASRFASLNPGMMVPPNKRQKFANNGIIRGKGTGTSDSIPIMASNGEAIIDAKTVNENPEAVNALLKTGKFEPKIDLTGSPGNIARSAFSYSGVNRLIGGQGMPGATVGGLPPSNVGAVAAPVMRAGKYGNVPLGPEGIPAEYGHITTRIETTVDNFLKELLSLPGKLKAKRQTDINRLTGLQEAGGGQASVNAYTSLAGWQSHTLNQAVGKGETPVPTDMFVKDLNHFGTQMWIPALKDGGTTLKEVDAELTTYHESLKEAIVAKGKENKTGKITGQQYEKIEAELRKTLPSQSKLRKALDQAAAKIDEYRINISSDIAQQIKQNNPGLIVGEGTHESLMTRGAGGNPTKIRLKGDRFKKADILGRQSLLAAQQAGEDLGTEATNGAAKGAATQSPSKKTIKVGEDIARGLTVGMQNQQSNVTKAGETLANGAVSGTRRATRNQSAPAALPMSIVTAALVNSSNAQEKNTKELVQSTSRVHNMNGAIQSGSFALMGLSGVAQMFGGTLGKLSSVIFGLSGALFALQTITQLMTKQQFLSLTLGRLQIARGALATARELGPEVAGIAGRAGMLGNLGKVGLAFRAFLGPIGIASVAVAGLAIGLKMLSDAHKRELEEINGLSNAMNITTSQVKALGDFFNVIPRKLAIDIGPSKDVVGTKTRSAREELKANSGFQKEFGGTIKTLSKSTDKEASLALTGIAIRLKAQGFATEQIQTLIDALREEAKKTSITLDVKSIDFSPAGISNLQKKTESEFAAIAAAGKKSYEYKFIRSKTNYKLLVETLVPTKEFKKAFVSLEGFISTTAKSAGTMFKSGEISAAQYQASITSVLANMEGLNSAQKRIMLLDIFKNLGVNAEPFLKNLKDTKQEMQIIALLSAGILDKSSNILSNLASADPEAQKRGKEALAREAKKLDIVEQIIKKQNAADAAASQSGPSSDVLSKEAKLTIARLQKELDGLKTKRDVINETNNELKRQYDYQQKLMQLSKDAVQAKISGDYIGASILGSQKSYETSQFNKETDNLALDKKITALENRISELQANAKVTKAETALNLVKAKVAGKAMGGLIKGPGTETSDSITAGFAGGGLPQLSVSNGEYIVQAKAVQGYGVGFMDAINNQKVSAINSNASSTSGDTVYNVNMTVNGGNANASDIADQVIRRLKVETSKTNKSNMVRM